MKGIELDEETFERVHELIKENHIIQAVKLVREHTDCGLVEARDVVLNMKYALR